MQGKREKKNQIEEERKGILYTCDDKDSYLKYSTPKGI